MQNIPPHIDELIAKHLAFETSQEEMRELEAWLNEDEANRNYYYKLEKLLLEKWNGESWDGEIDVNGSWEEVKEKQHQPKPLSRIRTLYYAAAAMIIFGIIGYFFLGKPKTIIADVPGIDLKSTSHTRIDTLIDGTIITLNKNSSLRSASGYNAKHRTLELEGEAFIEVGRSGNAPLIIQTSKGEIRDIGTSFSVNTRSDSVLNISVTEGEVELTTKANAVYKAKAGEQLEYNTVTNKKMVSPASKNATAFKTYLFEFDNDKLKNIVQQLNEVYNTNITYDKALEDCAITVTFNKEKLETILDIIAETLKVKYGKQEGGFHLAGNKCN